MPKQMLLHFHEHATPARSNFKRQFKKLKIGLLAIIAAFLLLVPWLGWWDFFWGQIHSDGIRTSATVVMTLTVVFSMASWSMLSWASKSTSPAGMLLSVITGASLAIPFIHVLGPMAAVIVGIVAGFSAFMLQKKITEPERNITVIIAAAALAAAYLVIASLVLSVQSPHVWDAGYGVASWTGTVEGIEESGFDNIWNSGIGFVYFFATVPSLAATVWVLRGETKTRLVLLGTILLLGFFAVTLGYQPLLYNYQYWTCWNSCVFDMFEDCESCNDIRSEDRFELTRDEQMERSKKVKEMYASIIRDYTSTVWMPHELFFRGYGLGYSHPDNLEDNLEVRFDYSDGFFLHFQELEIVSPLSGSSDGGRVIVLKEMLFPEMWVFWAFLFGVGGFAGYRIQR